MGAECIGRIVEGRMQESVTKHDRLDSLEGLGRGRHSDVGSLKLLVKGRSASSKSRRMISRSSTAFTRLQSGRAPVY